MLNHCIFVPDFFFSESGAETPPFGISINTTNTSAIVTWLPPSMCNFNYTVNITNSSSVTKQMYSNSTSLILTDLIYGENYSFAVAVTDSTGQHGPWSEKLKVTWDDEKGGYKIISMPVHIKDLLMLHALVLSC